MIDFGGVYFRSALPMISNFAKKIGVDAEKLENALMGDNWNEYAEGRSNESKYWNYISDALNLNKEQKKELKSFWYHYSTPNDGMVDLIRKIKKNNKVVVLSGNVVGWVKVLEKKYKISKEFHEQHYSFHHGVDKPNVELFLKAAKKMNVEPKNCVVVDDNREFLSFVKNTGAKTILFKDAIKLEKSLKNMGVVL